MEWRCVLSQQYKIPCEKPWLCSGGPLLTLLGTLNEEDPCSRVCAAAHPMLETDWGQGEI